MRSFHILDLGDPATSIFLSPVFSRRPYFSVTLLQGNYALELEDTGQPLSGNTLLLTTSKFPFGFRPLDGGIRGFSCVFAESFVTKNNSGYSLLEFPVYKPGVQQLYSLSNTQTEQFTTIFARMFEEARIDSPFQDNLQRTYLLELIFNAQKLQPSGTFTRTNNTAEVIACSFVRLLEAQFPIESPRNTLRLKTVKEFADELAVHPNYLNRQVKTSKGKTVSDMIATRIIQEAKLLLKLTSWNVSEIAWSLGFEEPAHFNLFFKKHCRLSPTEFRKQQAHQV